LARYYLRALEKTAKGINQPEYVANEDVSDINLEHVLPLNPDASWNIDQDAAQVSRKLLGNMVLLKSNQNRDLGNGPFSDKRAIFSKSGYDLTKETGKSQAWGLAEIIARQARLAKLAVTRAS
jgi:hypothetical protein